MSKIRSKGTKPELEVFRYLRREKICFQKHYKHLPGKPDIAIPSRKVAVFIDGDFWHGWHFPKWSKRIPQAYWREKIENNIRRDKRNFAKLRRNGWKVLRIWEHELTKKRKEKTLRKIVRFLRTKA